jgi:hypothetical protein
MIAPDDQSRGCVAILPQRTLHTVTGKASQDEPCMTLQSLQRTLKGIVKDTFKHIHANSTPELNANLIIIGIVCGEQLNNDRLVVDTIKTQYFSVGR